MCTRILWNRNDPIVVARTMDWPDSTMPVLNVFPAGIERNGGQVGGHQVLRDNPLRWTSRYGSVVTTIYGVGTADGINEFGLAAHMLYLEGTDFGPRDPKTPGLLANVWVQYLLDSATTVTEALELLADAQIVMMEAHGHQATVHLAMEDAGGDSAIIEYPAGRRGVHHSRGYIILTNEPSYEEQIRLLSQQNFSDPGDHTEIDGNVNPVARFQRAAYFSKVLPQPTSERQAVAGILAIARNVSIPFGSPYEGFGLYNTEYRTVCDLTHRRYFFELATSPNVVWIDLPKLNLSAGARPLLLDPDDINLSGEVSGEFSRAERVPF